MNGYHIDAQPGQVTPGLAELHAKCDAQAAEIAGSGDDFDYVEHGSVCILSPITVGAFAWCAKHLPEGAQRFGSSGYVVEPRFIDDVLFGIQADGLKVAA